jgi:hypothetical protein
MEFGFSADQMKLREEVHDFFMDELPRLRKEATTLLAGPRNTVVQA